MKRLDLVGQRYGRLLVVAEVTPQGKYRRYRCQCDCGGEKIVRMGDLRSGNTRSCGCLHKDAGKRVSVYDQRYLKEDGIATNLVNNKVRKDSSTKVKGVYKSGGKFKSSIGIKGEEIYLGTFESLEEATAARLEAEKKYHEPYRHGGKRSGAGRPATGAMPTRSIRMTDEEYTLVKKFLKEARTKK